MRYKKAFFVSHYALLIVSILLSVRALQRREKKKKN